MSKKRGQYSATNAATLVALIAGMILLYILFLPPEAREGLLEENASVNGRTPVLAELNKTLLLETPGRLSYLAMREREHDLPSVHLATTTSAAELKQFNSVYIKNGWFDKKSYELKFNINSLTNTKNIILAFSVIKHKGRLVMKLNSNLIFDSEVTTAYTEPLKLSKEYLKEGENIIEFSVSPVEWQFWTTNEYSLKGIKVIADITDVSAQEAKNVFFVTSTEKFNLDRATLRYVPDCATTKVGSLDIYINKYNIFSGVPDCGIPNTIEFSPNYLNLDENVVTFGTKKGEYLIDRINIKTGLKELTYPVYYFELTAEELNAIKQNVLGTNLTLEFTEKGESKIAEISINGHLTHMETREQKWWRNIDSYVQEGNNYIKIIPKTTIDVVKLEVKLN